MKINPMRSYDQPGYPVRPEVDAHPELLRLLPKRWQGNAVVVAALMACLALSGCGKRAAGDAPSRVAPVFVHGDGMGAYGCKIINPPVFLSEDEAAKVIQDEAKRAGVAFERDGKALRGVEIPVMTSSGKKLSRSGRLALDGMDKKRGIGFEFVSLNDSLEWRARGAWISVGTQDLKTSAKRLRDGIAGAKPAGTYAVFYDPVAGPDEVEKKTGRRIDYRKLACNWQVERAKIEAIEKDLAREELRAQVKDFIKWLKAQGVI